MQLLALAVKSGVKIFLGHSVLHAKLTVWFEFRVRIFSIRHRNDVGGCSDEMLMRGFFFFRNAVLIFIIVFFFFSSFFLFRFSFSLSF